MSFFVKKTQIENQASKPVLFKPFSKNKSAIRVELYDPQASQSDSSLLSGLIRNNIKDYERSSYIFLASERRAGSLKSVYAQKGNYLFLIREPIFREPIACIGLGTLHGLPSSEGIGEIRDLIVDPAYRRKGYAASLLKACLVQARKESFKRIYLETTQNMTKAQKLFYVMVFEL